jgi:molybdate transport system substrate-binding protein
MVKMSKLLLILLCLSSNATAQDAVKKPVKKIDSLTIFSEVNMTYPLVKIARLYSEQKNVIVSVNFNSSSELIQNIDAGEPADVFIASHPVWIETLKQKGLVDVYNLANIAKDKLVLVTSKKNPRISIFDVAAISDINKVLKLIVSRHIPLIVDSKDTSLGKYTSAILDSAKIPDHKIYHRVNEDKKSIADFVNDNDGYCGIIMASSLRNYDNITVLKNIDDSEIYYQALVIAGDSMEKARDFLKFLKSEQAKTVFAENGFIVE